MAQPAWIDLALAEIGQRELGGAADNPRIVSFYRDVGHPEAAHDEVAWCAAFVGAALERSGIACTRSLLARSYLSWGEAVTMPKFGAVAVFSRGSDPTAGHVAFYLDADTASIFVLGGNQGDAVSITAIERSRLLGFRWPTTTASPAAAAKPATASQIFERALAHVLEMEGGWTEDQYDPGGPTNFGITLATLAAHRGLALDANSFAALRQQLREISSSEVRTIYLARYWTPSRAAALAPAVGLMHFDAAVNHGVGAAARMLQQAVGVDIDGEIGPATLAACAATPAATILQRYADERRARYRALGHFWRFGRGWLARVDATLRLASTLDMNQPQGDNTMTDSNSTSTTATTPANPSAGQPTKWWGESLTMWGAFITAASTVVPVLGPLFGIDITAEMVHQLGTQGVQAVQVVGGLAGTLMTIFGRIRANTRLGLRSATAEH